MEQCEDTQHPPGLLSMDGERDSVRPGGRAAVTEYRPASLHFVRNRHDRGPLLLLAGPAPNLLRRRGTWAGHHRLERCPESRLDRTINSLD
jgi:hypothetical protein